MELKVWVEGIVRVISGVDERTTCQVCGVIAPDIEQLKKYFFYINRMLSMHSLMQREKRADLHSLKDGEIVQGMLFILLISFIFILLRNFFCNIQKTGS